MINSTRLLGAAALLLVGCAPRSNLDVDPTSSAERPAERKSVTFYVPGMNRQLKIL